MKPFHTELFENKNMYPNKVVLVLLAEHRGGNLNSTVVLQSPEHGTNNNNNNNNNSNSNSSNTNGLSEVIRRANSPDSALSRLGIDDDMRSVGESSHLSNAHSLMSVSSINATDRMLLKCVDSVNFEESFYSINMREFTILYEELMGRHDGMSSRFYNPEDFAWWAKNLSKIVLLKKKMKGKKNNYHQFHEQGCACCSSIFLKISKQQIEELAVAEMEAHLLMETARKEKDEDFLRQQAEAKAERDAQKIQVSVVVHISLLLFLAPTPISSHLTEPCLTLSI
jgi:hypothetical protein